MATLLAPPTRLLPVDEWVYKQGDVIDSFSHLTLNIPTIAYITWSYITCFFFIYLQEWTLMPPRMSTWMLYFSAQHGCNEWLFSFKPSGPPLMPYLMFLFLVFWCITDSLTYMTLTYLFLWSPFNRGLALNFFPIVPHHHLSHLQWA